MRRSLAVLMLMSCATTKPLERLAREHIQGAMLEHRDELSACVREERRRSPSSSGKVLLRFRIQSSGEPTELRTDGASPELDLCLRGVLASVRFPAHEHEGEPVTWPLQF